MPAGSSADLKLTPVESVAVAATWFALLSVIWKVPENVPVKGTIKPKLAAPVASLVKEVTFKHPVEDCG